MSDRAPPPELFEIRPELAELTEQRVRASAARCGMELVEQEGLYALRWPETGRWAYGHRDDAPEAELWHCHLFLTTP